MWYHHACLSPGCLSPAPKADLFYLAPGTRSEPLGHTALLAAYALPALSPGPHTRQDLW